MAPPRWQMAGGRMVAFRFAAPELARKGFAELEARIAARADVTSRSSFSAGSNLYARYSGAAVSGLVWVSGTWLISVEAKDAAGVEAVVRVSHAGGLSEAGGVGHSMLPGLLLAGAGVLVGLVLMIWLIRAILRGMAKPPVAGAPIVSRGELENRLLALNDQGKPYLVRRGPEADLVVEWKFADAEWWGILAKAGVRKAYRLRLYVDEKAHRVGALDEFGEVDWSAGLLGAPRAQYSSSFFRGVQLVRRERGVAYGFKTPTGGGAGKVLDYRFDIDEVKEPVIEAVTTSGWTYQPILWPKRRSVPPPPPPPPA